MIHFYWFCIKPQNSEKLKKRQYHINSVKSDKQQKRPDLFLMLHWQSKANVFLISKKSKTWRLVFVGHGSCINEYLQVTYTGEERLLLPQLIPSPWAVQQQCHTYNTTTLQSFCQHSCWSQITAHLAAGWNKNCSNSWWQRSLLQAPSLKKTLLR